MNYSNTGLQPLIDKLFPEDVERFTLPNGLVVLLKEAHRSQLASVQVWVKTGSIHEGDNLGAGLSHFLEHMLFKGTERREGEQISREVQEVGGYINAYTTFDRTVYYIDCPGEATKQMIDVLGDAAFASTLPEGEVAKEREVILREIAMGNDDPDRRVAQTAFATAFRQHPYRHPVIGYEENFREIERDTLAGYYKARYVPNNTALVVVGDFDAADMRAHIEERFAEVRRKRLAPVLIPMDTQQLARREERLYGDFHVCRGIVSYHVPGLAHPDSPALSLLANILGRGDSALLNQRLREDLRLVHHIDASCWNPGESGLFFISYLCDTGKREAVEDAITALVAEVAEQGVSPRLLAKATRSAVVGEVNARKTVGGQAGRVGVAEVVIGDAGYPQVYLERLRSVETGDLARMAQAHLRADRLTAVTLENESRKPKPKTKAAAVHALNDFEVETLPNGARLLYQHEPSLPKVNIRVVMLGGPCFEKDAQRGITGLLATHLIRDNKNRSARQVAETIEEAGGSMSEFAGNNSLGYGVEVLSQDTDLALGLLRDGLLHPVVKPETFELERDGQIAAIKEDEDEIFETGLRHLRGLFYGDHPFRIDADGTEATLAALNPADVEALYGQLVRGGNVVVGISGDFDRDICLPRLRDMLKELPGGEFDKAMPPHAAPASTGDHFHEMRREQAVVFQAYPDVGAGADDFLVGALLQELYSEMSGNLFMQVREKRSLAYFVGASRVVGVNQGMFYLYAGTQPSTTGDVFEQLQAEIERTRVGGLTEAEIQRGKTRLKVQKRSSLQTPSARTRQACLNALYGLPVNSWRDFDERVDRITPEAVVAFATRHFADEHALRLTVGPKNP